VSASGYLLFGRDGSILAQAFNREGRAPVGEPAVIVSNVLNVSRYTHFALGPDDTIVYVPVHATPTSDLVWYDREGNAMGKVGAPLAYHQIVMAPDGRRVAVERDDPPAAGSRLGLLDLTRGTMLAANPTMAEERGFSEDSNPVWAPDGRRLAFTATIDDEADLFVITPSESPVRLRRPLMQWAEQWSADGRFLLYTQTDSATKASLWAMPLEGDRTPFVLVDSPFLNDEAQLSPDGRWLVYGSNESGRFEVYIQRFASRGERWRLSTDGGSQPKWRADGRELFYVAPDGTMMTVAVPQDRDPGQPTALFRTPLRPVSYLDQYAVTPDGQRFLIIAPSQTNESARLMVISNWPALLRR
jgi:Tol biopolymer transport system component